jgi:hypothetical protein
MTTSVTTERPDTRRRFPCADVAAAVLAMSLVAASTLVIVRGHWYSYLRIYTWAPPLFGYWHPHVGPGTPAAIVIALAAIRYGPGLAMRWRWRTLTIVSYVVLVAWTIAVHLVDGWQRGVPGRLATGDEYLVDVPRILRTPGFLREFTSHILAGSPGSWAVHVSGHPPGATLVFVWLARLGLAGPVPAAMACVLIGGLTTVAVPATIRALGDEWAARATVPFLALFPGAAIAGVSADWLFAGVTSTGVALLAAGATRLRAARPRWALRPTLTCAVAGLILGYSVFLSYGLVVFAVVPLAVVCTARSARALLPAVLGVAVVVAVFAVSGFWWWDGYQLVVVRYYQDVGRTRPYDYWVWANIAALALTAGPAVAVGLRRATMRVATAVRDRRWPRHPIVLTVALAASVAVAIADESGLSKAETERIWLPFAVWLVAATSLVPPRYRRWWLAAQVVAALVVRHLVWVQW